MQRNKKADLMQMPHSMRRNKRNLGDLFQKFADDFVGDFHRCLKKITGSDKKGIEKDVEKDNEDKSRNGFKCSMIGSLKDVPPERKRTDPDGEKKRNCEKHKNFFHVKPPLTFGV